MFTPFYHKLLRRYHTAFGSLFNDLVVVRRDTDNAELQRLTVPIEFTAREPWLARLRADPNLTRPIQATLPRLAYDMTGLHYDAARKLNTMNQSVRFGPVMTSGRRYYAGVPYTMSLGLYLISDNIDDMNQMVEQIVPYFTPDYTLTVKSLPTMGVMDRCRIMLDPTPQWSDTWDTSGFSSASPREVVVTLTFTMHTSFYGPVLNAALIRKVIVDLHVAESADVLMAPAYILTEGFEQIQLEDESGYLINEDNESSTPESSRVTRIEVVPDPLDAAPVLPVDMTVTITDYVDGQQANPVTGVDSDT